MLVYTVRHLGCVLSRQLVGLQLLILKAGSETEIDTAFASLVRLQAGALLVGSDPFFNNRREQVVTLASRYAVPAIYDWREFAAIGGLISYGPSLTYVNYQAGVYAGRILKGEKRADLRATRQSGKTCHRQIDATAGLPSAAENAVCARAFTLGATSGLISGSGTNINWNDLSVVSVDDLVGAGVIDGGTVRSSGRRGRADLCQINDQDPRAAFDLFPGRQGHHPYSKNAALVSNISRKVGRRAGRV
jgi:hypothetical protein